MKRNQKSRNCSTSTVKENDHIIKKCPKLPAKEANKKEAGMVVAEASTPKTESANLV
jgi:hypothetical protein